jgi:hypothetical protein
MNAQNVHPKWWQLYLLLPLLVGLFMADFRLKLPTRGHQIVQLGILLFVYWLVHLWLKANEAALGRAENAHYPVIITLVQTPLPNERKAQPLFHLPDSEVKGLLDNTFEIDIIDAEFLPMEEVPHEISKE